MSLRFRELAATFLAAVLLAGAAAWRSQTPELRVCADPDNLPFSNRRGEGFENRLATLIAQDLHASLIYTWAPQRRGFVRKSLDAGTCDVVMGVPANLGSLRSTAPYYRSTYVFVSRQDSHLRIHSLEDPILREKQIGVQVIGDDGADTPPAFLLAKRGLILNVRSYPVPDDAAPNGAMPRIIDAVARGTIDVAVVWGPIAGYWARHAKVPLTITPVRPGPGFPAIPLAFDIAVGVQRSRADLQRRIDSALVRRKMQVARLLEQYGIPRPAGAARAGT